MSLLAAHTVIPMSPARWVLVAFLAVFTPFGWRLTRQVWRGEHPYLHRREAPGWWILGAIAWRGFQRGLLVVPVVYTALVLAAISGGLIPSHASLKWVPTALGVLFFLGLGVIVALALFGRPRTLIAPALRGRPEPGAGRGRDAAKAAR